MGLQRVRHNWACIHSLVLEWKLTFFSPVVHCWVFQIDWHVEWSTLTALSFRILNNSAGIPSPPPALFIVMFLKAHLISHSRMCASGWVATPSRLSGSLRPFLFSVFLPPLLNIFCFCYVLAISDFYCAHLHMKCPLVISNFLEEISNLFHSIVFLYFFALFTKEVSHLPILYTLHSVGNIFPFILCLLLFFFSQLFIRPPQTTTLPSCIYSLEDGFGHYLVYNEPPFIVLQVFCPPDLILWISSSPPLHNHKWCDLGHTWMV